MADEMHHTRRTQDSMYIAKLETLLSDAEFTLRQASAAIKGREHTGFIALMCKRIDEVLGRRRGD